VQNQKKVDPRTAIINSLLTGPKTQRELKREVTEQGVPPSTYHYVLGQMIKHGEVGGLRYCYKGQRLSDAAIEELLGPVAATKSPAQEIELSKNLMFLARKPGIALQPRFLSTLEECLTNKLTNESAAEVRRNALSALSDTLWNVDDAAYAEDKKAREIIRERFFNLLANIALTDADLSNRGNAVTTLAELGDPRAIDVLAEIVEKVPEEEYRWLQPALQRAIVWGYDSTGMRRNYLVRHHRPRILMRLSDLAAEGNKRASELADQIRRQS